MALPGGEQLTCNLGGSCFYVLVKRFTCRMCAAASLPRVLYVTSVS